MPIQPISRDLVINLIKQKSPVIPNDLKRELKQGDTMLIGAMLSELASKNIVKITHLKFGGSPFYYDPAQPETLEKVGQHLNEKDQRTWKLLKEKKVLHDKEQDLLTRVSLRNIKDFAIQVPVTVEGEEILFWKYYLLSDEEAEPLIKHHLGLDKPKQAEPVHVPTPIPVAPVPVPAAIPVVAPAPSEPVAQKPKKPRAPRKPKEQKSSPAIAVTAVEPQQQLLEPIEDDEFFEDVKRLFEKGNVAVHEQHLVKRNSEIDFVILVPTVVGNAEFFCKAKKKAKSTDADIAAELLQGMRKHLPVIYLTNGEITPKAEEMLKHEFKGLTVKRM